MPSELRITPDLIFYIILPVLVFEAGIGMDPRYLRQELDPIRSLGRAMARLGVKDSAAGSVGTFKKEDDDFNPL